jgi:hypothetical protein
VVILFRFLDPVTGCLLPNLTTHRLPVLIFNNLSSLVCRFLNPTTHHHFSSNSSISQPIHIWFSNSTTRRCSLGSCIPPPRHISFLVRESHNWHSSSSWIQELGVLSRLLRRCLLMGDSSDVLYYGYQLHCQNSLSVPNRKEDFGVYNGSVLRHIAD